jgi:hypothetical protein
MTFLLPLIALLFAVLIPGVVAFLILQAILTLLARMDARFTHDIIGPTGTRSRKYLAPLTGSVPFSLRKGVSVRGVVRICPQMSAAGSPVARRQLFILTAPTPVPSHLREQDHLRYA